MNDSLTRVRESFYAECEERFGFSREEIVDIISKNFSGFNKDKIPEYLITVENAYIKRLEIEAKAKALRRPVSEIACPICGADTIGDPELYGKYTKTDGWRCMTGGVSHFYRWKTNKIRENQGLDPIDWSTEKWDND